MIFTDLNDMIAFPDSAVFAQVTDCCAATNTICSHPSFLAQAKADVMANPHFDSSREVEEFKGFFLERAQRQQHTAQRQQYRSHHMTVSRT